MARSDFSEKFGQNLQAIRDRMEQAAERTGRDRTTVKLIVVTKSLPAPLVREVLTAPCTDLGESRPQSLWDKASQFPTATWHLIGKLQRNKVARTTPLAAWIHSVDSLDLLDQLQAQAERQPRMANLLLQLNISHESTKQGFSTEELPRVLEAAADCPRLPIRGLMGIASQSGSEMQIRGEFACLRRMAERYQGQSAGHIDLQELSMGMSHDFEIAIEEGATMIRIGSALFDGCTQAIPR